MFYPHHLIEFIIFFLKIYFFFNNYQIYYFAVTYKIASQYLGLSTSGSERWIYFPHIGYMGSKTQEVTEFL